MAQKPDGFYFEDDDTNEEEIDKELEFSNLINPMNSSDEEEDEFEFTPEPEFSPEELRRRYELLQTLIYNKDRIINSQVSHIERLEKENRSLQDQYQMLYSAFSGLSGKAKDMLKREKVLKLFLKSKDFGIEDIDEFINEIRVKAYYKNKEQ